MHQPHRGSRTKKHPGFWLGWSMGGLIAVLLLLTSLTAAQSQPNSPLAPPIPSDLPYQQAPVAQTTPPVPTNSSSSQPIQPVFTGSDAAGQPTHISLLPPVTHLSGIPNRLSPHPLAGNSLQDWQADFTEDFEGDFPGTVWQLLDNSDDGFERSWGLDDLRANTGNASVWVAAGGSDSLDPEFASYPDNLDSWMVLGPLDLQNVPAADVEFHVWRDTEPEFDYLFVGASTDGVNFDGQFWSGTSGGWQYHNVDLGAYVGLSEVWLAWYFHSDDSNPEDYAGVWVDDITLWLYTESEPPATTNLIQNPDFETGDLTGWEAAGSTVISNDHPRSGNYSAWLGGVDETNDALYQIFSVPDTDINSARINFWFELASQETTTEVDQFCAGIHRESDDELLIDLGCLDGTERTGGWSEVDYPLSGPELLAIADETVYLGFFLETDGSLPTSVWIDDVAFLIETGGPAGDIYEDNDAPATATQLNFDTPITDLTIDPAGDLDYFAFQGSQGQTIALNIDAAVNGSSLDAYLWLLDTDGNTILAENDDDENSFDPYLIHTLPADGTYYAVVSSYSGDGDRSFFYTISLTTNAGPPPTPPPTPTLPPPANKKPWTAILYLAGDTNLWRDYQPYIQGLERLIGSKSAFLDVVVLLDLAADSPNPRTIRYHIQPNGNYTDGINRWDMGELNMGDPQNLVNFARWAMQNYPAEHYYLAVDDHGNSVAGIAWDDTNGEDNLTPPELYSILKEITNNGTNKIDVLAWEACLMQMVEGAYDMRNFADYLYGFESVSSGGNTYPRYFENLTASTTPAQFAQNALNVYFTDRSGGVVGSIIDLSQIGAVQTAVDNLADALLAQVGTQKNAITQARSTAQKFDVGDDYKITADDYYLDLWHLADRLAVENPAVAGPANAVKTAVDNAVMALRVQSAPQEDHSNAHGLGIYWPRGVAGAYGDYVNHRIFTSTRDGRWDEFLASYFGRRPGNRRGMPVDPEPVQRRATHRVFLPMVQRGQ